MIVPAALAKTTSISIGDKKLTLDLPDRWVSAPDLYGLEYLALGPVENGTRPTVSVTDLRLPVNRALLDELARTKSKYLVGKKKWLAKRGGTLLSDSEEYVGEGDRRSLRLKVRYALGDEIYRETSVITGCKAGLFHLKAVLNERNSAAQGPTTEKILETLGCL